MLMYCPIEVIHSFDKHVNAIWFKSDHAQFIKLGYTKDFIDSDLQPTTTPYHGAVYTDTIGLPDSFNSGHSLRYDDVFPAHSLTFYVATKCNLNLSFFGLNYGPNQSN